MNDLIQEIEKNESGLGEKLKAIDKSKLTDAVPQIIEATIKAIQTADYANYNFTLANEVCGALKEILAPRNLKKHADLILSLGEEIIKMNIPEDVQTNAGMKIGYVRSLNGMNYVGLVEMLMKEKSLIPKIVDQSMRLLESCEGEIDSVIYPITTIVGKSPEDAVSHINVFIDITFSNSYSWSTAAMALPPLLKKNPQPFLDRMEDVMDKIEKTATNLSTLHGSLQIVCAAFPDKCEDLVDILKEAMTAPMMGYHCLDLLNILAGSSEKLRKKMVDLFDAFEQDSSVLTDASSIYMSPKLIATLALCDETSAKRGLDLLVKLSQGQSGAALLTIVAAFKGISTSKQFDKSIIEPHLDTIRAWVNEPDGHTKEAAGGILAYYEGRDLEAVNTKAEVAKSTADEAKETASDAKDLATDAVERVDIVEEELEEVKAKVEALENYQSSLDEKLEEMKDFVGEIVKKLPIPAKFDTSGIVRKRLILTFFCLTRDDACTPKDFCTETAAVNKWLKVALSAVNLGVAAMEGDAIGGLSAIYDAYTAASEQYDSDFQSMISEPFLTSEEQDKLINQLRDAHFFDEFSYNPRKAGWQCSHCYKRDIVDPQAEKEAAKKAAAANEPEQPKTEPKEEIPVSSSEQASARFEEEFEEIRGEFKRRSGVLKRWKKAYGELDGSTFTIKASPKARKASHSFDLKDIKQVSEAPYKSYGKNTAIVIKAASKTVVLDLATGEERGKWISAFKKNGVQS